LRHAACNPLRPPGLIAQVFPTIVLALLIEGRIVITARKHAWLHLARHIVRALAITSGVVVTFACLIIAAGAPIDDSFGYLLAATVVLLLVAFTMLAVDIISSELSDIVLVIIRRARHSADDPPTTSRSLQQRRE
jgi:hypothetical protein